MPVEIKCQSCGKLLMVPPSRASRTKLCSKNCGKTPEQIEEKAVLKKQGFLRDQCSVCGKHFKRKYRKKGLRQAYCSKKCYWKDSCSTKTCKTCGKQFRVSVMQRKNKEYCSIACIQRSPCQFCGKIITGRRTFQSGEKRFCSRKCGNIVNRTINAKKSYVILGYYGAIMRRGRLECERCGFAEPAALIVHHKDRNRSNNHQDNLETLCANCHAVEHWKNSENKNKQYLTAKNIMDHGIPDSGPTEPVSL